MPELIATDKYQIPERDTITAFLEEPFPCDGCPDFQTCRDEEVSCEAYHYYVHDGGLNLLDRRGNPTVGWYYTTFKRHKRKAVMPSSTLFMQRLTDLPEAALPAPQMGDPLDAGYDVRSTIAVRIAPGDRYTIPTGYSYAPPPGYYLRVAPRSGLAVKHGIDVLAGVVDNGYRGELAVVLINQGDIPFEVHVGDRIAQFILEQYRKLPLAAVPELPASDRGLSGFGDSGIS